VASVVENRLIGIVGNCMVLPVARGFKLDPTYQVDPQTPADLLDHYAPLTPIPPMRISVPTNGVFAEAVMGSCNSCELKDDARFWRWEESPNPDEPTAINTIGTDSRATPPPDLTPKDFPTPIVNIQNAPAAPDPTGLAAALQLLSKPDLFKDITGLEENQKNAIAAFGAVMDASKFFGGTAAKLAQQRMMTRDIDKTLQAIQKAERAGLIDHSKANALTTSALRGMLGEQRQPKSKLTDQPEVRKLIESAGDSPKSDVAVKSGGENLRVKLNGPSDEGSATFDYNVPGLVPVLAQPSDKTCWATVTTMMISWRDQASYTIAQVMDMAGAPYDKKFKNNQTLRASEKEDLLDELDLRGEPPMSYAARGLLELLRQYGPLWVTTDEDPSKNFSIHARIVIGMYGDGSPDGTFLRIVDPAGGRQYDESFATFARKFEEEARDTDAASPLRVQVVHFPSSR
jgi:hypothetical protein